MDREGYLTKQQLEDVTRRWQQRRQTEDIDYIESLGGQEGLLRRLNTDPARGISSDTIPLRVQLYGSNVPAMPPVQSIFSLWREAFFNTYDLLFTVGGILSLLLTAVFSSAFNKFGWLEGLVLVAHSLGRCLFWAVTQHKKQKELNSLRSMEYRMKTVRVLRDGVESKVSLVDVVVGDVMPGEVGLKQKRPFEECLEERDRVREQDRQRLLQVCSPVFISGTSVSNGNGLQVVTAVGENTCINRIRGLLMNEVEPEAKELVELETAIIKRSMVVIAVVVVVLVVRLVVTIINERWQQHHLQLLNQMLGVMIILGVVLLETGALSTSISASIEVLIKKLMNDCVMVRKLSVCSKLGQVNYVLTEKTGVLTHDKLKLATLWNRTTLASPSLTEAKVADHAKEIFFVAALLNDNSQQTGSRMPTFEAIIEFALTQGVDLEQLKSKYSVDRLVEFTSNRKRQTVFVTYKSTGRVLLLSIGAAEMLQPTCSHILDFATGKTEVLSESDVKDLVTAKFRQAQRTLAITFKELPSLPRDEPEGDHQLLKVEQQKDWTLLCVAGVRCPLRAQASSAVKLLQDAGVQVLMETGDNKITATMVAEESGIIKEGIDNPDLVMEGPDFSARVGELRNDRSKLSLEHPEEFGRIIRNLRVMARSRPEDKFKLVTGLQNMGNVVAVVGGGTGDAPALSAASVGIGLGISGTDVSKQASDVLLLDDDFATFGKMVMWGRWFLHSAVESLEYRLTVRFFLALTTVFTSTVCHQSAYSCIQVIWILAVSETAERFFVSLQKPRPQDLMKAAPPQVNESMLTPNSFKKIAAGTVLLSALLITFASTGLSSIHSTPQAAESDPATSTRLALIFNTSYFTVLFIMLSFKLSTSTENLAEQLVTFSASVLLPCTVVQLAIQYLLPSLFRLPSEGIGLTGWFISLLFASAALFSHFGLVVVLQTQKPKLSATGDKLKSD